MFTAALQRGRRRLRKYARPVWLLTFLAAVLGGLVGNGLTAMIARKADPGEQWVFWGALAGSVVLVLVREFFFPSRKEADLRASSLQNQEEKDRAAHRGLVAFVSLYKYHGAPGAAPPADWIPLAEAGDWEALRLDTSATNQQPLIQALLTNSARLEHVWLVATDDGLEGGTPRLKADGTLEKPGSRHVVPALRAYLKQLPELSKVNVHERVISLDSAVEMTRRVYRCLGEVFQEAEGLGLPPSELVVDTTGGLGAMTIGAILACVDGERVIEYMEAPYDVRHHPGSTTPVLVEYDII